RYHVTVERHGNARADNPRLRVEDPHGEVARILGDLSGHGGATSASVS
ncbi:MAG: hypothetical protein IID48_15590, partial [Proteobacteria bacterium]|nr:hypothetical protein [Pseudomonadota bacterium]